VTSEGRSGHAGHPGRAAHDEDPEKGFTTDQPLDDVDDEPDALTDEPPAGAAVVAAVEAPTARPEAPPARPEAPPAGPDLSVLDVRPVPGKPREYRFPAFQRARLANGLTVIHAQLPGRALLAAQLLFPGGAAAEPADQAGVTVLAGRAMPEGTKQRDAITFIESAERLGAELHADTTWEALSATLEVPRSRFGAALALLAEMVLEPAFPGQEVDRLRDERLNDLMQAWADPRRRAERVFPETIYAPEAAYTRPLGGMQSTVRHLDRDAVAQRHAAALDPGRATLIVSGDLAGLDVEKLAEEHFAAWQQSAPPPAEPVATPHPDGPRVVLVDRPGAPQSEVRIGHIGLPRQIPDFHAVSVLNAILGGTFNSRLNRLIREERGYSYSINSSFDLRRAAGPFAVRTAVETRVTVPAVVETLGVLRAMSEEEVEPDELRTARDYLVGVFPLRFEGAAQVAAALSGLVVFELPDDELDRYRPQVAAVEAADVLAAARSHVRPHDASIVIIGDAAQVEPELRSAELGELTIVPHDAPLK
jgi:zinc protease